MKENKMVILPRMALKSNQETSIGGVKNSKRSANKVLRRFKELPPTHETFMKKVNFY